MKQKMNRISLKIIQIFLFFHYETNNKCTVYNWALSKHKASNNHNLNNNEKEQS